MPRLSPTCARALGSRGRRGRGRRRGRRRPGAADRGDACRGRALAGAGAGAATAATSCSIRAPTSARSSRRRRTPSCVRRSRPGELLLHYQPIVDTEDGLARGVEALVRWEHPEHGLLGPGRVRSGRRGSGAIVPLGDWVLRDACRQVKTWQAMRAGGGRAVAVGQRLAQRSSCIRRSSRASSAHCSRAVSLAERLYLEVAQADLAADAASDRRASSAAGARCADFDRRCRLRLADSGRRRCRRHGQGAAERDPCRARSDGRRGRVVAQRVEDREHEEQLRDRGCRLAQGYLYARPAPANEIDALLAAVPVDVVPEQEALVES